MGQFGVYILCDSKICLGGSGGGINGWKTETKRSMVVAME
jgi:hypothetical protein